MTNREQFIASIFFNGKADYMQVKFASDELLSEIKDAELSKFAKFALSLKSKFDNSSQMLLNAVKEYQAKNYTEVVRQTKPFQNITELRNFINEYFKGKIIASGVSPFIYANISLNADLKLINENTNKPLNAEDESELLSNLLKNQNLIGVNRPDLISERIKRRDEIVIDAEMSELEKIDAKVYEIDEDKVNEAWGKLLSKKIVMSFVRA